MRKNYIKVLKCRECGKEYPPIKIHACEDCFGPLEAIYDLNSIEVDKHFIEKRSRTLWRYYELLPIEDEAKIVDLGAGFTPLHQCRRLAETLGIRKLYIKNDTVNPTGSFKDRPATVAVSKSLEFEFRVVGCASTGNLAAATAAHAAKAGLPCYVFIPFNTEKSKVLQAATYGSKIIAIKGTYDDANRLAAQASYEYDWGIVNINLRPYYVEGSKTIVFEICEQLGWRAPENIIIPMGSGALLCAIWRGLKQFKDIGLINELETRLIGAQPEGCSPIVKAFKSDSKDVFAIERPETIAKSLAIGDPSDGIYALKSIKESRGLAEYATDKEIIEGMKLLAKNEGIFAEPAGGITIAILKRLIESGNIARDEEVVCCVTGSGFKSLENFSSSTIDIIEVEPNLNSLENLISIEVL
ncbi:MAG: threonine synthase [Nitrososphaerales archaeon]